MRPHVSYLDMITEAISNLRERSGSSEDSIAKFIKEHYQGGTPRNFRRELKSNLKKYVESKELVKVKNSYKIPLKKETKKPKTERSAEQIMGDLKKIQRKLDELNQWTLEEIRKLKQKHEKLVWEKEAERGETLRQMLWCVKRDKIIESIPNFWSAAFLAEPSLQKLLKEDDKEIMGYLKTVVVEDRGDVKSGLRIIFNFEENPFFDNVSLSKEISFSHKGIIQTSGTKINWKGSGQSGGVRRSFLAWFSDSLRKGQDRDTVAEIIAYSLWPNAPLYFVDATTTSVNIGWKEKEKLLKVHDKFDKAKDASLEYRWHLMEEYDLEAKKEEKLLRQQNKELRRSMYDTRSVTIKEVPSFWLNAFLSHYALGGILSEKDHKIFKYLESVNVEETEKIFLYSDSVNGEETEHPTPVYTITLDFNEKNPYFENASLRKTFSHCVKGVDTKDCTIKWKDNMENGRVHPNDEYGFFSWFSKCGNVSEGNLDEVAELIIEDLWPNAFKYYINGNRDYEEESNIIEEIRLWLAGKKQTKNNPI